METYTFTSHSSNETMDFASNLANKLKKRRCCCFNW